MDNRPDIGPVLRLRAGMATAPNSGCVKWRAVLPAPSAAPLYHGLSVTRHGTSVWFRLRYAVCHDRCPICSPCAASTVIAGSPSRRAVGRTPADSIAASCCRASDCMSATKAPSRQSWSTATARGGLCVPSAARADTSICPSGVIVRISCAGGKQVLAWARPRAIRPVSYITRTIGGR